MWMAAVADVPIPPHPPEHIIVPNVETQLKLANQNMSALIQALMGSLQPQATQSSLGLTFDSSGGTVLVSSGQTGTLVAIAVTTPSTGLSGTVYDVTSEANATSSNAMALIPSSGIIVYNLPYLSGLTVQPSSSGGHTVSVFYT